MTGPCAATAPFELGDSETHARPYSLRAFAACAKAFYNATYDPLGSLALAAEAKDGAFSVILSLGITWSV